VELCSFSPQSAGTQSGLGDITQSFFFSPREPKKFIWGVGPALLIPTATDDLLGTEKFGVGPTLLVLKQQHAWTYTLNSEMSYDWSGNAWNIPIHFTVSKLVRFGKHPVSFGGALRCCATSRRGGPEHCGFRFL
jgi:hypothetical protein